MPKYLAYSFAVLYKICLGTTSFLFPISIICAFGLADIIYAKIEYLKKIHYL